MHRAVCSSPPAVRSPTDRCCVVRLVSRGDFSGAGLHSGRGTRGRGPVSRTRWKLGRTFQAPGRETGRPRPAREEFWTVLDDSDHTMTMTMPISTDDSARSPFLKPAVRALPNPPMERRPGRGSVLVHIPVVICLLTSPFFTPCLSLHENAPPPGPPFFSHRQPCRRHRSGHHRGQGLGAEATFEPCGADDGG